MHKINLPAPQVREGMSLAEARRAALQGCWQQIEASAAEIVAVPTDAEPVHRLRVGLRRLRSLQRFLSDAGVETPAWAAPVAQLFRRLSAARDHDVVDTVMLPRVQAAFASLQGPDEGTPQPPWHLTVHLHGETPAEVLRDPASQRLLRDLRRALAVPGFDAAGERHALQALAKRRLERWHRRVLAGIGRFADLDEAERHALRKRIKRLRYAAEWVAPLYPRRTVKPYLVALNDAQTCLGEISDVALAWRVLCKQVDGEPQTLFALGWLAAQRECLLAAAPSRLSVLAGVRRFWAHR
ncbi:MAG: CHAD domain-containing protein [Cytophagales bacterium]|nr:CHAD domain-containing protein [Rhizobacter sp.]